MITRPYTGRMNLFQSTCLNKVPLISEVILKHMEALKWNLLLPDYGIYGILRTQLRIGLQSRTSEKSFRTSSKSFHFKNLTMLIGPMRRPTWDEIVKRCFVETEALYHTKPVSEGAPFPVRLHSQLCFSVYGKTGLPYWHSSSIE